MVALTGQWWLDARDLDRDDVSAHLVNLAWNGLAALEREPALPSAESSGEPPGSTAGADPGGTRSR
jgi:hypothetical protein